MNGERDPRSRRGAKPATPEEAGSQAFAEALRSSFGLIRFVMVLLVVAFVASCLFTVGPGQQAIILRFGKPVAPGGKMLLGPGLHWKWPAPIDEKQIIAISEVQSVSSSVGWYAGTPEQLAAPQLLGPPGNSLRPGADGYLLTGDTNIVHSAATLFYRVNDPVSFLFNSVNSTNVLQDVLDNALIWSASRFNVDDILYSDIAAYRDTVRRRVSELIQDKNLGVAIDRCDVRSTPPRYLDPDFARVVVVKQEADIALNKARETESRVMSSANAQTNVLVNSAQAERNRIVKEAQGEAGRFTGLLTNYQADPHLFAERWLTETMKRALTNADVEFLPALNGEHRELRLLLNRELPRATTPAK